MNYTEAHKIAVSIRLQLEQHCEPGRCLIAGSIRRKKSEVGDIEIVCQPKMFDELLFVLFNEPCTGMKVISEDFAKRVKSLGKIIKGKPDGRMMQIELPQGIMLDLFMPQPHDYFRQFAIRTGSADYSFKTIATAWKNIWWCGTPDGLRKINECEETKLPDGKKSYKCTISNPTLPPEWQSEKEFFEWLKIPYLEPEKRNV